MLLKTFSKKKGKITWSEVSVCYLLAFVLAAMPLATRAQQVSPQAGACSTAKPTITANGPTSLCAGGTVLLTASQGKSYKWSNGATSQSIAVTKSGSYKVEVSDANGCVNISDEVEVSVAERLKPPKIEYTAPLVICKNGSVHMSVPAQEGAAYVWKKDGVPVSSDSHEFTASESGVYTVELSNFCGAVRASNKVEFNVQEDIPAFAVQASGNLSFCKGGEVVLTVPEYKNVTYAWYRDGEKLQGNSHRIVATEAGKYKASITNECSTYTSTNELYVDVLPLPAAPEVKGSTGCTQSSLALTASGGKAGMYRWYTTPKGGTAIAGATGPDFSTAVLSSSVTYYVAISNGQCESERVPVKAVISTKPSAVEIEADGPQEFCAGGSVVIRAKGAASDVQYKWMKDGQVLSTTAGTKELEVTETGEYSLVLQNDCGTSAASNKVKIKVLPMPAAPAVQHGSTCGEGVVTLTASGGDKGEYRWYESETATTHIAGNSKSTFITPALKDSRTYFVSVVKGDCESERVPVQAHVYPVPQASASVQDQQIESGETTRLMASGGVSYSWSPATGLDDPTSPSPMARPEETTRYTVTVRNENGCEDTASVEVNVRQLLVIPNAFSPNGDGLNDTWEIDNIEYFPDTKVEVYNRWGNLIFERTNYRNEWDGTYRGAKLPVSTYFYVITVPGKNKFTGYLNIVN